MPPKEPELDIEAALANLPSDAFSSDYDFEDEPAETIQTPNTVTRPPTLGARQVAASSGSFRQTTLFGSTSFDSQSAPSQATENRRYRIDLPPEAPTHHALNTEALKTWVFPTNLGTLRDYQYSIVKNGLFNNTLVALPTGLGKTFIAATVMLNFYRWTKDAQVIFMAPTKPLVAQQVDACFNICGIPRSVTTMLTGEISPPLRAEEWASKRVFFTTPQTVENDLKRGVADPKRIVLLVVDEAHRATGNYSYVKVIEFLRRFNKSYRILALTATPGSSVEAVQEVIDGLEISKVEIRTENSIDIKPYTHDRQIEKIVLEPSDELKEVLSLLCKTLQPIVDKLAGQASSAGYFNRDPASITAYGMVQSQQKWLQSPAGRSANQAVKGMVRALFTFLAGFGHSIKLLTFHGLGIFFQNMKDYRAEGEAKRSKIGKYQKLVLESPHFKKMMDKLQLWTSKEDFIGHPKVSYLCDTVLNHFLDAGEGMSSSQAKKTGTRIIVFCEYRNSAEEIVRVLNKHKPMIRASVFVGQAAAKHSEGMNQKTQIETIEKFKDGTFNVIVATSIGEEGLDIGQVDLIVCYDNSSSPIRMLQRMGRTGRKRAGKVVLLLMKGKEEESFAKANDNYEKMQKMISDGKRFTFRHDLSRRIVPREVVPVVDKRIVEIPIENTQTKDLPEPRRRPKGKPKNPPKKFHMPDNVETGFQSLSSLWGGRSKGQPGTATPVPKNPELAPDQLVVRPPLDVVYLTESEEAILNEEYLTILGEEEESIDKPDLTKQPLSQRSLRPIHSLKHGVASKRLVKMLRSMNSITSNTLTNWDHLHKTAPAFVPATPVDDSQSGGAEGSETDDADLQTAQMSRIQRTAADSATDEEELDRFKIPQSKRRTTASTNARSRPTKRRSKQHQRGTSISLSSSDDQVHTEDEEEQYDSDLADFIVSDTEPTPSTRPLGSQKRQYMDLPSGEATPSKRFFEPTQFTETQETEGDDEMPDMGSLLSKGRNAVKGSSRAGRKKRKVVIEDSEDDEEDRL